MNDDDIAAERRRAEAAQWFARLKSVPVSRGTLEDFFAWRRDKANAEAFEQAERFWTEAGKVGERPAILRAVQAAIDRGGTRSRVTMAVRPAYLLPGLAAVVVVLVLGYATFTTRTSTFHTAVGERQSVALSDGSQLQLDTQTHLQVRFTRKHRQLVLQSGEALFNVAHDAARPFTVSADGVVVTATGTQFDVSRWQNTIAVTLIEGHVTIRTPRGETLPLQAGQQWRWSGGKQATAAVDTVNVAAWTHGRIVFDKTPLADAIRQINRYGGDRVTLDATTFANRKISGTFEAGDPASFVTAVTALLPLRGHSDEEGRIHLIAAPVSRKETPAST